MLGDRPVQIAGKYLSMGIVPVPVTQKGKKPSISGWTEFRPDVSEIPKYFNGMSNIGLLLGSASNNLVSIDMDWEECAQLYDLFFPDTPVYGRLINGVLRARQILLRCDTNTQIYDAPIGVTTGKRRIVELLSTGKQVVAPGSTYADGALIEWIRSLDDIPLQTMSQEEATLAVKRLAGAALMARLWRDLEGSRHSVLLAMTGALCHAGWEHEQIIAVMARVIKVGRDTELRDRKQVIQDTLRKAGCGKPISGLPNLSQYLQQPVIDCLVKWWGLGSSDYELTGLEYASRNECHAKSNTETVASPMSSLSLAITNAADIKTHPISWLWPGRVPLGKLTIFAGDPGLGKSLLTANLAAHVTCGKSWPVDHSPCPVGEVMILSAEDDPEDTIVPRLSTAGADSVNNRAMKGGGVTVPGAYHLIKLWRCHV